MLVYQVMLFLGHVAADNLYGKTAEVAAVRTYFYVGGGYVEDGNGGHIFKDQMYVEKLEPAFPSMNGSGSVVMIHGQAQTGTNFLNKPDDGLSWTSQFLEAGQTVYIVDQTFRGRSAWAPRSGAESPSTYSAELHTQWPGLGVMGDPVFDAFYSSNVQFIVNATYQQQTMQAAGAQLLDMIGAPAWLLGHSQGGLMPLLIADARPSLVKGLILVEPTGPPFQEVTPWSN